MNKTTKQEGFFPMEHTGKRALVLAGGGAKGSYQIGVWRALQELDWTPDIITGASVGTLNGCLFTMGKIQEAEDLWRSWKFTMFSKSPQRSGPRSCARSSSTSSAAED